ncbi:MAG: 16S rRNA (uracil(1498)-N(3))-methyltransferase [Hyphomicrobiaceae bacterium]|nr:16S rRNA (uracil(1498)-N(3))-methyltransferase [Hyphomicrobiaceae bacterium]
MTTQDINAQRIYVDQPLGEGGTLDLSADHANYLINVLRLTAGARILVFNGTDGEWACTLAETGKRRARLQVEFRVRAQAGGPDLHYLFAPLKRSRLDYMVQKAVEMGCARLQPVITRYTVAERVNLDRMRANVVEAAEQCGILRLADVGPPMKLVQVLADWDSARRIVFCDEAAEPGSPIAALNALAGGPLAVLVGPEGGFSPEEREMLLARSDTVALSLGPRIMRADTAAVAALALVNATLGDWATLGDRATLCDRATLGDGATPGDRTEQGAT